MVFWWREHPLSFEQECEYLRYLGYGVELRPTMRGDNDCRYVRRNWSRLKEAADGMLVSLASRDDGPTLEEWTEQIECAKTLDACVVTNLNSLCVSDKLQIADWGFAGDVVDIAKDKGVDICVEGGSLSLMLKCGQKFDSIKYCLDTGYAHVNGKNPFTEYVDKLAERTTYLHLTDNLGKTDDHEPLGIIGGIPRESWEYLLDSLRKYDNEIIGSIEMFPPMPSTMIKQSSQFLFDIMGWPNRPQSKPGFDETSYHPL